MTAATEKPGAKFSVFEVRYQISRWMRIHGLDIREATIQCANTFTQVCRDKGHPERLCLLMGETITRIGAEWAAELAIAAA